MNFIWGGNSSGSLYCNDVKSSFPALSWNKYTASTQGNLLDILSMSDYDGIRYLFYTLNQLSDHFPSRERPGDNNLPNGSNSYLVSRYQALGQVPTNPVYQDIGNETFNFAIRATATLFYWFANRVGLSSSPITPLSGVSLMGDYILYADATGHWYTELQNGMEPFTYKWEIMYLDNSGYLQNYESVKKEKEKKDKEKKNDGEIIIELAPSNYWYSTGTNSPAFSRLNNGSDLRDFKLRCTVTDAANSTKTSNEFYVDVTSNPPPTTNIVQSSFEMENISLAKEAENSLEPNNFSLEQNHPNPFNPTTTINYSLKERGQVLLSVYNMLGQKVIDLVNSVKEAGTYSVTFDGSSLPSGVYVYRIQSNGFNDSKKLLLLK